MSSDFLLEAMQIPIKVEEFSKNQHFPQIEERILNWLDQREIFMIEPVNDKVTLEARGRKSVLKFNSSLLLLRKKKISDQKPKFLSQI